MSQRTDTLVRYGLIAAGAVALILMYVVADNENLNRNERFSYLVALGSLVLVGWPGLAITHSYADRRPLRIKWGKPPRPVTSERPAPESISPEAVPVTIAINNRNSLMALGGSIIVGSVLGALSYALAGSAGSDQGGFLLYVGVAGATLIALRSAFRIITGHRAVTVDDAGITLGLALDYVPPLTIARSTVSFIETAGGPEPKLAIVNDAGRRYEVRLDQLRGSELPNHLAALWPAARWREVAA